MVCDNGDLILPSRIFPNRQRHVRAEDVYLTRLASQPKGPSVLWVHIYHSSPQIFLSNHFEDQDALEKISEEIGKSIPAPRDLPFPFVAFSLCVVIATVFVATYFSAVFADASAFVEFGAWHKDLVATGEIYRFIAHAFLHKNLFHLGLNILMLVVMGFAVEHVWGHGRWLAVFVIGSVVGSLGMYLSDMSVLVGASGGAYGVLGAYLYLRWFRNREYEERLRPLSTSVLLFVVMVDMVVSNVYGDAAAAVHLTAVLAGGLYAIALDRISLLGRVGVAIDGTVMLFAGLLALQSLHIAVTWNQTRLERLAGYWLETSGHPEYVNLAGWLLATSDEPDALMITRAIKRVGEIDVRGAKDTLATLYARSGNFERAVSIENEVFTATPDALFATQLARFERRHNVFAVDHNVDGETLRVDEPATIDFICGDRFERLPVERSEQLAALCKSGPQLLAIRPGVADKGIKLRLDDRVLALPLD